MNVILDTNVFVSGLFFKSGPPGKIMDALIDEKFKLVISPAIFDEYHRIVSALKSDYPQINIEPLLDLIFIKSVLYEPKPLLNPVTADPQDDIFIACALVSRTNLIVSGDKHLLDVTGYQGIKIIKPRQFYDQHLT